MNHLRRADDTCPHHPTKLPCLHEKNYPKGWSRKTHTLGLVSVRVVAYACVLALPLFVSGCAHDFDPPFGERSTITDPDPDGQPKKDRGLDSGLDVEPAGDFGAASCSAAPVVPDGGAAPPGGDCSSPDNWFCAAACKGFRRLACFDSNNSWQREIVCDAKGRCECRVNGGTTTFCSIAPSINGREGCQRAREALKTGNCCLGTR